MECAMWSRLVLNTLHETRHRANPLFPNAATYSFTVGTVVFKAATTNLLFSLEREDMSAVQCERKRGSFFTSTQEKMPLLDSGHSSSWVAGTLSAFAQREIGGGRGKKIALLSAALKSPSKSNGKHRLRNTVSHFANVRWHIKISHLPQVV